MPLKYNVAYNGNTWVNVLSYILSTVVFVYSSPDPGVLTRILAGCTTGAMAVSFAQPTDVVKVRFQAQMNLDGVARRYSGTMQAYRHIFQNEGLRGLWKGVVQKTCFRMQCQKKEDLELLVKYK